jgi:pimeloyl-ACP methyl ester carboxylesterase
MKEKKCTCNGLVLNYMEDVSEQPPILLLHGATSRWQSYSPIIPYLTQDFHIYALDFRGHGLSQRAQSYTLTNYVSDTYAFIKEHIKSPVVIVGHSLGGMVGLLLAAYYPNLVEKLVLIDTPLTLQSLKRLSAGPVEHAHWLIHSFRYSQLVPGLPLPEGVRQCDPEVLLSIVNEFEKTFGIYKEYEFFSVISCPVLLIRGSAELGSLINDDDLNVTLKLIPHLTHIKITYAGHSPITQDKQAVLQAIQPFLASQ